MHTGSFSQSSSRTEKIDRAPHPGANVHRFPVGTCTFVRPAASLYDTHQGGVSLEKIKVDWTIALAEFRETTLRHLLR
jgi:hypothetical protein